MTTTNNKLVPHKRFPEFENSGEWEEKKLEDIVDVLDNLRRPISKNNRIPGQYPYYGANGIMDYINDYIFDGTYLLLGEDGSVINQDNSPVMHIAIGKFWVNNHAHVVKEKYQLYNLYFIYYALHNANIEGLVKGIPPKLNQENLKTIKITISDVKEQQKIADFLSSVDELIKLEQKKLEKLKEYKKGLLENLFPKENQKVPDLRFPEFKNNGEWVEKKIKDILDYEQPTNYIVKSDDYSLQGTPVLTANKSFILGYTNETSGIYNNIPVIIFDDFTTDKKYVAFPFKVKSSAIKILSAKNDYNVKFIYELMTLIPFNPQEHRRYYIGIYQNIEVLVPSLEEQQKIAEFLSSVDKLIIEQENKIKLLHDYKKGLLQQLFPN